MITTARLTLRPWKMTDISSLTSMLQDKEIYHFTRIPKPYTIKHAKEFIKKRNDKKSGVTFAILLNSSSVLVGNCGIHYGDPKLKTAEIGFIIHRNYRRQGIAFEAITVLLSHGFNKLKLNKISVRCSTKNIGSKKLIEKLGFVYEGLIRQEIKSGDGKIHDIYQYSILRREYLAQKKKK